MRQTLMRGSMESLSRELLVCAPLVQQSTRKPVRRKFRPYTNISTNHNFSCTGFPADSHKIVLKLEVLGFSFNCWFQFYTRDLNQSWVKPNFYRFFSIRPWQMINVLVSLTRHKLKQGQLSLAKVISFSSTILLAFLKVFCFFLVIKVEK